MPGRRLLIVLALLGTGCSSVLGTADEIGELFAEGGDRVLREPMRPISETSRVLVIALDGVGEDVLTRALDDGDLPALSALLGADRGDGLFDHAVYLRSVPSVFPSLTVAGWAAVFSGAPPAVSGVSGNEWFDRGSRALVAPVPLSADSYEQTVAIWSDSLLGRALQAPTVFEQADRRAHVSLGFVFRGADLLTPPDPNDLGDVLEGAIGTLVAGPEEAFEEVDDDAVEGVERGIERYGVPDLQVAYLPGPDLAAHELGLEGQRDYLRDQTNDDIEGVLDAYRRRGALDGTTIVVVSDHGQIATLDDDRHSLSVDGPDEPPALLEALGYRLLDPDLEPDSSDANLAVAYGGAVATLTVGNGTVCIEGVPCDWSVAPRFEADVLPLGRALADASELSGGGGLDGALDLVLVRASDPSGQTSPPFLVLSDGRPVPIGDYLDRVPRPDLVDIERRLGWLTDGPLGHRAGDVLLLTKSGEDQPVDERFYFGDPRRTAHGGASPSQSMISLLVARPVGTGAALRREIRGAVGDAPTQLDVTPLLLFFLGVSP